MKYHLVFDESRCIACGACTVSCMDAHDIESEPLPRWCSVAEAGDYVTRRVSSRPFPCWQCEDTPCVTACRFDAMRLEGGFARCDAAKCVGCRACEKACPVHVPRLGNAGTILKCDGCLDRLEQGLDPFCVKVCPMRALRVETAE